MEATQLVQMAQQMLFISALVSAPIVLCAAIIGIVIGILQSIFSVQDASLTHAFRAGGIFLLLISISGWAGARVYDFAVRAFQMIN